MKLDKIIDFGGLATSLANPPFNSAKDAKNFETYKTKGWLTNSQGYLLKYALPTLTNTNISSFVPVDFKNFYVPDHGGKNVTCLLATYRKTSRYDAGVHIDRSGAWIRPYWNGSSWIDSWLELTEIEIVELNSLGAPSGMNLTGTFPTYLQASNYFENWIAVFEDYSQSQDHDNYVLITDSSYSAPSTNVDFFGTTANLNRSNGAKVILCRSFLNQELPSALTDFISQILNDLRITTGNSSTDLSMLSGLRTKTFGWATSDQSVDRIILDVACLNVWRYAFHHDLPLQVASVTPIPKGIYYLRDTLVMDDDSETELRDPSGTFDTNAFGQGAPSPYRNRYCTLGSHGVYLYNVYPDATTESDDHEI